MGRNSGSNRVGGSSNQGYNFSKDKSYDIASTIQDITFAQYGLDDLPKLKSGVYRTEDVKDIRNEQKRLSDIIRNSRETLRENGLKTDKDIQDFLKWAKKKHGINVNLNR